MPFHGTRLLPMRSAVPDDEPLAIDRRQRMHVLQLARAYQTVMPAGAFFCGRTAAVALEAPIEHGDELEVAVLSPGRAPRARGVSGRTVSPQLAHVRSVDGLPVSSPASTWAMLGRDLSVQELVIVGDFFVRIPRDTSTRLRSELALATPAQLRTALEAGRRAGAEELRAALAHVRVGSGSPLETRHRLRAVAAGLPEPELDVEIRDDTGTLLGISEFVYRKYLTVVEVEGDHHRTSRKQWLRDLDKYEAYAQAGWRVVRVTSAHVRSSDHRDVQLVADALRARGWAGRVD